VHDYFLLYYYISGLVLAQTLPNITNASSVSHTYQMSHNFQETDLPSQKDYLRTGSSESHPQRCNYAAPSGLYKKGAGQTGATTNAQ